MLEILGGNPDKDSLWGIAAPPFLISSLKMLFLSQNILPQTNTKNNPGCQSSFVLRWQLITTQLYTRSYAAASSGHTNLEKSKSESRVTDYGAIKPGGSRIGWMDSWCQTADIYDTKAVGLDKSWGDALQAAASSWRAADKSIHPTPSGTSRKSEEFCSLGTILLCFQDIYCARKVQSVQHSREHMLSTGIKNHNQT